MVLKYPMYWLTIVDSILLNKKVLPWKQGFAFYKASVLKTDKIHKRMFPSANRQTSDTWKLMLFG